MSFPPQGSGSGIVLTPEEIRDALLSIPEAERKFIITNPNEEEFKVLALRKGGDGEVVYDYEDVPG